MYDGNWDQDLDEISHNTVYKAFDKRFNDGKDWEETEYYRKLRAKIVDGKSTRAGHSQSELQQYFGDLETLYENIVDNGYQTQSELEETAPKRTRVKNMDAPIPSMNEIGVCIGRDGTLIHRYRGAHRLAVAKTAGIDAVPVQVLSRHKQWQCIRDTFRDARTLDDVDQEYRSHYGHPDLEDVAPETD
ncbi:hypothetical protein [Natronobacterium texcoconense]|uniref:hypothetical protein n=1 Tax=Natronobacterium texcoconense TaxID=1095778 RepID=UPI000B892312|nr:hypothetical protein [Natronobacterium texcoconense]